MARLTSPAGVTVSVSDGKAERLKRQGYRAVEAEPSPKPKRSGGARARKPKNDDE